MSPLFDGINDSVNTPENADIDVHEGSMMIWVKISAAEWISGANRPAILWYCDYVFGNIYAISKSWDNNKLDASYIAPYDCGGLLTWINCLITYSLTDNKVIFYVNGINQGEAAFVHLSGAHTQFVVGAFLDVGQFFSGCLSHAAIWNKVLIPTEILELYNGGR